MPSSRPKSPGMRAAEPGTLSPSHSLSLRCSLMKLKHFISPCVTPAASLRAGSRGQGAQAGVWYAPV